MNSCAWNFGTVPAIELLERASTQVDTVVRTIRVAIALTGNGRRVDLTGLEHHVGMLCAQTLDLAWDDARSLRPKLAGLLTELDHLASLQRSPH